MNVPVCHLCTTTDTSIITAIGNDYDYDGFARQLQAIAVEGDIFIAFSSGSSPNIISALKDAKSSGITSILMTGNRKGTATDLCDYCLSIPSSNTAKIQEAHTIVIIFCADLLNFHCLRRTIYEGSYFIGWWFGTRLQPLFSDIPKPMAPINGKPFLELFSICSLKKVLGMLFYQSVI